MPTRSAVRAVVQGVRTDATGTLGRPAGTDRDASIVAADGGRRTDDCTAAAVTAVRRHAAAVAAEQTGVADALTRLAGLARPAGNAAGAAVLRVEHDLDTDPRRPTDGLAALLTTLASRSTDPARPGPPAASRSSSSGHGATAGARICPAGRSHSAAAVGGRGACASAPGKPQENENAKTDPAGDAPGTARHARSVRGAHVGCQHSKITGRRKASAQTPRMGPAPPVAWGRRPPQHDRGTTLGRVVPAGFVSPAGTICFTGSGSLTLADPGPPRFVRQSRTKLAFSAKGHLNYYVAGLGTGARAGAPADASSGMAYPCDEPISSG